MIITQNIRNMILDGEYLLAVDALSGTFGVDGKEIVDGAIRSSFYEDFRLRRYYSMDSEGQISLRRPRPESVYVLYSQEIGAPTKVIAVYRNLEQAVAQKDKLNNSNEFVSKVFLVEELDLI